MENVWCGGQDISGTMIAFVLTACDSKAAGNKVSTEKVSSSTSGVKKVRILVGQMKNPADQKDIYFFIANKLASVPDVKIVTDDKEADYWFMFTTYESSDKSLAITSTFLNFNTRNLDTTTGFWKKSWVEDRLGDEVERFRGFLTEK